MFRKLAVIAIVMITASLSLSVLPVERASAQIGLPAGFAAQMSVPPTSTCVGTQYYVSNSGSDSANGLSPATAWQTIAHVSSFSSFTAGQCINFNGGQTFSGNLVLSTVNSCSICSPTPSTVNVTGASPNNPIVVQSYGTGNAILQSNTGGDISSTVLVNSVNGFVVQNLTIRSGISGTCPSGAGANCTTAGVYVTGASTGSVNGNDIGGFFVANGETIGGGDITSATRTDSSGNVVIADNVLHGLTTAALDDDGVQINGSTGNIIVSGNVLSNFGGRPSFLNVFGGEGMNIVHSHSGTILITNNIVHDSGYNQTTQCGGTSGIETQDVSNVTISSNEVYNTAINMTTGCDGDGIDLDGSTTNSVVEYNYTHNNAGAGLYGWMGVVTSDWTNNTYRGNISENDAYIVEDNPQEFFGGMSFNNTGCTACVVYAYGNTIYQNSSLAGRGALVLATQNGSNGIGAGSVIADNIFAYTSGNYAVTCNPALTPVGTWRNNSYFAINGGTTVRVDPNCGSASAPSGSLAQWETRTAETGGTTSNPGFVGTVPAGTVSWNATGNQTLPSGYALGGGSPLLGVGVAPSSLSVTTINPVLDFYGTSEPNSTGSGWNIGAFGGN
jgi:hypothetical protein